MVEGSKTKEDAPEGKERGKRCEEEEEVAFDGIAVHVSRGIRMSHLLRDASSVEFQQFFRFSSLSIEHACPVVSLLKLTIHFPLICQDDFSPSARWVDGQGLLKALVNLRGPHPVRFDSDNLLVVLQ